MQVIFSPTYLPFLNPVSLLKAAPLFAHHLLERMMFLAPPVFSSVSGHLQLPFGIPNPMSATASVRQSFALNSKLASSALPMDPNHRTVCIVSFI